MSDDSRGAGGGTPMERFARALAEAFPDLPIGAVTPLGEGWDSVAVEAGSGIVFRFPKREPVAESHSMERRLLPRLRERLSVEVPLPAYVAPPSRAFPYGVTGYRRLPGEPLRREALTEGVEGSLAIDLARFLSELHRFPIEEALEVDLPPAEQWRAAHERFWRESVPALRTHLSSGECRGVERWWEEVANDPRTWSFRPCLVHRDLAAEHVLVDGRRGRLLGVLDWGDAAVGDPAIDFVGLLEACGPPFMRRVADAYFARGMPADPDLALRAARLAEFMPLHAVRFAARVGRRYGPSMAEAIASMRAGRILAGRAGSPAW